MMDIANQIRTRRTAMGLSQEDLAQRIYVSRQTISNWETERTYPDIQSCLLLSNLFGTTIDVLVKGDLEMMKAAVENEDVRRMNSLSRMMVVGTVVAIVVGVAGYKLLAPWGWLLFLIPYAAAIAAAVAIEKIKRANDVETYREIVAFMEGREPDRSGRADKPARVRETALKLLAGAGVGVLVCAVIFAVFKLLGL